MIEMTLFRSAGSPVTLGQKSSRLRTLLGPVIGCHRIRDGVVSVKSKALHGNLIRNLIRGWTDTNFAGRKALTRLALHGQANRSLPTAMAFAHAAFP